MRRSGIVFDRDEYTEGNICVGAAFTDPMGLIYAISIPAPNHRFDANAETLAETVRSGIAEIRNAFGGDGSRGALRCPSSGFFGPVGPLIRRVSGANSTIRTCSAYPSLVWGGGTVHFICLLIFLLLWNPISEVLESKLTCKERARTIIRSRRRKADAHRFDQWQACNVKNHRT